MYTTVPQNEGSLCFSSSDWFDSNSAHMQVVEKKPGSSYYHTPGNQMPFQSYIHWNNLHCQSLFLPSFPPFIFKNLIFTIYFSV